MRGGKNLRITWDFFGRWIDGCEGSISDEDSTDFMKFLKLCIFHDRL